MASEVDIANAALLKVGTSGIASLTDNSPEARAVAVCFDRMRDAELRAHPWKFAIERFSLGALSTAPLFGYRFQYQLPATYLHLVEVDDAWCWEDNYQSVWKIEGQKLLTDIEAPLKIRCVVRVTNTGLFEALFVETLASRIAHEICERLKQSASEKDRLLRDYQMVIREARRVDAIERSPEPFRETSWSTSRASGTLFGRFG